MAESLITTLRSHFVSFGRPTLCRERLWHAEDVQKKTVVIAAVAAVVVGGISGTVIHQVRAPRGKIPAASSSVSAVAATYLAAAKDQDCGLTRALTAKNGDTWAWCSDPRLLSYKNVGKPYAVGKKQFSRASKMCRLHHEKYRQQ